MIEVLFSTSSGGSALAPYADVLCGNSGAGGNACDFENRLVAAGGVTLTRRGRKGTGGRGQPELCDFSVPSCECRRETDACCLRFSAISRSEV